MLENTPNLLKKIDSLAKTTEDYQGGHPVSKCLNFISRFMCFASLPHSDLKSLTYERIVYFGTTLWKLKIYSPYGIPFGIWARRILVFICTEAIRQKNRVVDLGKTQAQFFKNVSSSEILINGGKRGTLGLLQEQARRLFSSSLYIECTENQSWAFDNSLFAEKGLLFWQGNDQKTWSGQITLSQAMYDDILKNAVPLEAKALTSLNSFSFDIYLWLRWKSFYSKQTIHMRWDKVFQQFGAGYQQTPQGKSNFKRYFLNGLRIASTILSIEYSHDKKKITIHFGT